MKNDIQLPLRRDDLDRLMRPQSVAIIGASEDSSRIGGRPLRYLRESGFQGRVYPVNPNRSIVQGLRSYPSIDAVPDAVDVVILAIPASGVVAAAQACANKGCGGLIIFSAGFAETGEEGKEMQDALSELVHRTGIRIIGPNCLGIFNAVDGFYATFSQTFDQVGIPKPGPIGVVSQSGAYGGHLAYLLCKRDIGIAHWITTGNECDISISDALAWVVRSPEVKVILLYAETVRDAPGFLKALQEAHRQRKPVIMIKVGRSESGSRAAASHTGALAGADAIYDAVLSQMGVLRAPTTEYMVDVAQACLQQRFPAGKRLGILSMSGGIGIQLADAAELHGLDVAPLAQVGQDEVLRLVPFAGPLNPIDMTAAVLNDTSYIGRMFEIALDIGRYDAVVMFAGTGVASSNLRDPVLETMQSVRKRYPERTIGLAIAGPDEMMKQYRELGFVVFEDIDRGIAAIAGLAFFGRSFARELSWQGLPPARPAGELPKDEFAAKQLLSSHGIPCLPEQVVPDAASVEVAARDMAGSVVVKILSTDIPHKTEVGGVAVNLKTPHEAADAARAIGARVKSLRPDAVIQGYLVAPMCRGIEIICGALCDPTFGPMVMVGIGGIHAELLKDVAFRMAPFSRDEALEMLDELKMRPLLDGVRGAPPSDIGTLADTLANLSDFYASTYADIAEIDINPFVLLPKDQGGFAVDALIVPTTKGTY
ncbi:acetate--CoA ligase family protein [Ottowia sp. VDI28]|uniref:acetate--CoA ligase family protein n=1 Tax=Ottowia sp. VDI28 TaxID=3133968 RepID=UPI003C2B0E44